MPVKAGRPGQLHDSLLVGVSGTQCLLLPTFPKTQDEFCVYLPNTKKEIILTLFKTPRKTLFNSIIIKINSIIW